MSLITLTEPEESYSGGALQMNSMLQWSLNSSPMINLAAFASPKQNTIFTIRSSYLDLDEPIFASEEISPAIIKLFPSNLSLKLEVSYQSLQRIINFLKCLVILSTLSQEALEQAFQKLENIQTTKSGYQIFFHEAKNKFSSQSEFSYQESESPEVIKSFLSVAKSMPVEDNEYDTIYSDEDLENF